MLNSNIRIFDSILTLFAKALMKKMEIDIRNNIRQKNVKCSKQRNQNLYTVYKCCLVSVGNPFMLAAPRRKSSENPAYVNTICVNLTL